MINQLRAILLERGIIVPQRRRELEDELFMLINEQRDAGVSPRLLKLVRDMRTEWRELDRRIAVFDKEFAAFAKENQDARRLVTISGVGVTIASALIAAVGRRRHSSAGAILRHGLDLSRVKQRPVASRNFLASASAVTYTCANC